MLNSSKHAWIWPALTTAILGAWQLTRPELWRDELATWDAASRTTYQLFGLLQHTDASSGAYYLFIHGWITVFGDSVVALRMPSLLAMAAAAAFVSLTAKRMFNARAGLAAGFVFALLPSISRFAQEARSYAFTACAVALATLLLQRALDRPGWRGWCAYSVVVTVTGALNLVALTFLVGHGVVAVVRWWRQRDRRILIGFPLAAVIGAALLLPVIALGLRQVDKQFTLPPPDLNSVFTAWPGLFMSAMIAGAVTVAALLAFGVSRHQAFAALTMAVLPIVAIWLVSHGHHSYWMPRYLLFTLPAWSLAAGAGIAAVRPVAAVAGLVMLGALGFPDQETMRTTGAHDWWSYPAAPAAPPFSYFGAAEVIAGGYRAGDGLVPVRDVDSYYMIDTGLRYHLPADVRPRDVFAGHTGLELGEFFTTDTTDPRAAVATVPRLWLVRVGLPTDPLEGLAPDKQQVLRAEFTVTRIVHPSRYTTVALLERNAR